MENATKALMIAGAVLLAILVIGLGMTIFSSVGGIMGNVGSQADEMEVKQFNSKFETYKGQKSGTQCRALVDTVITSNNTYRKQNDTARIVKVTMGTETEKEASKDLQAINDAIVPGKQYTVSMEYDEDTAFVSIITITEKSSKQTT